MTERKQWERQEGETAKAFEAFCAYRDLPPSERSMLAAWVKYSGNSAEGRRKAPRNVEQWAIDNKWTDRVKAYDDYLDAQSRAEYEAERLKQRDNRQQVVRALQGMAAKVMQAKQHANMEPAELNALANAVAKVLNESRIEFDDLPTQRVDNRVTGSGEGGAIEVHHVNADILAAAYKRMQEENCDGNS